MPLSKYLPSAQFSLMAGSLLFSGGLVYAADYITSDRTQPAEVSSVATDYIKETDWKSQLEEIQINAPQAPTAPDEATVNQLRASVQGSNLTQSLGKTLLINLTNAGAQGLGDDIPTQDKLVAQATAQLQAEQKVSLYVAADITTTPQTADSLHTYGNNVMRILVQHKTASAAQTLYDMGYATDYQNQKTLDSMTTIARDYAALAEDLANLSVPKGLAPLHLQLVNDFVYMSSVFPDMQSVLKDPLRGLAGLQVFQSKGGEASRVLTSIAQILSKNAILFNKDEAGAGWNVFLSS